MRLLVYSMRYKDPRSFEFDPDMKISEASAIAARVFGYEPSATSFCEHFPPPEDKYRGALVFDRDKLVSSLTVPVVELCDVGGSV